MANQEDIVQLLQGVTVFEALAPDDLRRVAQVAVPRRFAAGQVVFREGDASDTCYVVRRGHAGRCASTPTGARSRSPTSAPATSSASSRCSTTSAARRPSRRSTTSRRSRSSGADMRRAHARAPRHRGQARDRARRGACARPTSAWPASPSRPSRAASPRCSLQLVEQAQAEGAARRATCSSTVTQAEVAQLAGSSRESASRFLAVLERAGDRHPGPRPDHRPRSRRAQRYVF